MSNLLKKNAELLLKHNKFSPYKKTPNQHGVKRTKPKTHEQKSLYEQQRKISKEAEQQTKKFHKKIEPATTDKKHHQLQKTSSQPVQHGQLLQHNKFHAHFAGQSFLLHKKSVHGQKKLV